MNDENILKHSFGKGSRTVKQERAIQSAGGKASGKSRRRAKTCREVFKLLREALVKDEETKNALKDAGIDDDDMTYGADLALQTMLKARNDPRWARLAYEMMGENETQGSTVVNNLPPNINVNFVKNEDGDD